MRGLNRHTLAKMALLRRTNLLSRGLATRMEVEIHTGDVKGAGTRAGVEGEKHDSIWSS